MLQRILRVTSKGTPDYASPAIFESPSSAQATRWVRDNKQSLRSQWIAIVCHVNGDKTYFLPTSDTPTSYPSDRYKVMLVNGTKETVLYSCRTAYEIKEWKRINFPILRQRWIKFVIQTKDDKRYALRTDYEDVLERRNATLDSLSQDSTSAI